MKPDSGRCPEDVSLICLLFGTELIRTMDEKFAPSVMYQ